MATLFSGHGDLIEKAREVSHVARTPQNRAIRVALEQHDMGRAELAKLAGIHVVTLHRVVAGHQTLSAATAARVASVLGTTAEALGLTKAEGRAE